jgi:hypothetical protein
MANEVSQWTKCEDGSYCAEASSLGFKAGVHPCGLIKLPDGYAPIHGYKWEPHSENGELLFWQLPGRIPQHQFIIFND